MQLGEKEERESSAEKKKLFLTRINNLLPSVERRKEGVKEENSSLKH